MFTAAFVGTGPLHCGFDIGMWLKIVYQVPARCPFTPPADPAAAGRGGLVTQPAVRLPAPGRQDPAAGACVPEARCARVRAPSCHVGQFAWQASMQSACSLFTPYHPLPYLPACFGVAALVAGP